MSTNPLAPNPETNIDNPGFLPDEPEDLGEGVPVGEPDEGSEDDDGLGGELVPA